MIAEYRLPHARWVLTGCVVVYAAAFSALSIARHRSFLTARYDLGNMTQAVWNASEGGLFRVTDGEGRQVSRLAGHVDPILGAFAPLWKLWPDPTMLLVVQAIAVATIAIPTFLLGRRWLQDDRLALAFALAALLLPAIQWATVFDFHPVTLAAPLLMWCIWAAVERNDISLALLAVATAMTKEQVGLALALLGVWMIVSLSRRVAGTLMVLWGLGWTVIAVKLIIPHYSPTGQSALLEERYGDLGSSVGEVLQSLVTRPWDAVQIAFQADRLGYLLALVVPLLGLSLLSPLLVAGAVPDLALNLLSSRDQQHAIEYHYSAVIAPFLIAAAIAGLARLRRRDWPRGLGDGLRPGWLAGVVVGAALAANYVLGPLPFWSALPGGSDTKSGEYRAAAHIPALKAAVDLVPPSAVVSAGNRVGGHLSARRRILVFPVIEDAEYVVVDLNQPDVADRRDPVEHARHVAELRARPDFALVSDRDGVLVFRRRGAT